MVMAYINIHYQRAKIQQAVVARIEGMGGIVTYRHVDRDKTNLFLVRPEIANLPNRPWYQRILDIEVFDDVLVVVVTHSETKRVNEMIEQINLLKRPRKQKDDKEAWKLLIIFSEPFSPERQEEILSALPDCNVRFSKYD